MGKIRSYLLHYAVLIFATSLLSFWCFKTLASPASSPEPFSFTSLSTILSLALSLFITLISAFLFRRYAHWARSVTKALNRMAAGHLESISSPSHPLIEAYNNTVTNLQTLLSEHERQKERLRQDVNNHANALNESGKKLNQALLELKDIQSQMAQAEKHRSLSAIVSGFAHEINNPLTGILGYLELLELQNDLNEVTMKRIGTIKTQAVRIKSIITELSQLDPDGKQVKMPINLSNLLEKLTKIYQSKNEKSQVVISANLCSDESLVFGNHFALWQVFEGLVTNAIEACTAHTPGSGKLLIETRISQDKRITVTVKDNGGGFKEPSKAFDPFYTTKNRTQRRGIGLSLAYKIIAEHGGTIAIKNQDQGAIVTVTLPLQTPPLESEKK